MNLTALGGGALIIGAILLGGCGAGAGGITAAGAFARATPPGTTTGIVYLDLSNSSGRPDRLLGGSTPAAASIELHETRLVDGMMQMRGPTEVDLPAGQTVHFAPEGLHLMLVDLAAPLVEGSSIELTVRFEHAAPQTLRVPVLGLGATAAH